MNGTKLESFTVFSYTEFEGMYSLVLSVHYIIPVAGGSAAADRARRVPSAASTDDPNEPDSDHPIFQFFS